MGTHLVTGYGGKEHITAADQGLYNAGTLGDGKYVLPIGSMFEASVITNNLVKIKDGCLVNQGRNINIAVNDYEECEIDNGIQALKRNDIIVIRYDKNADTGIETASTIVIKGVSGEIAVDPEYITGNIFNGDNVDDFPLYRVKLEGLNITAVEPLFNTIVSFKSLMDAVDLQNKTLANLNTNLNKEAVDRNAEDIKLANSISNVASSVTEVANAANAANTTALSAVKARTNNVDIAVSNGIATIPFSAISEDIKASNYVDALVDIFSSNDHVKCRKWQSGTNIYVFVRNYDGTVLTSGNLTFQVTAFITM